jgi:CheY-like chemotaxis protein
MKQNTLKFAAFICLVFLLAISLFSVYDSYTKFISVRNLQISFENTKVLKKLFFELINEREAVNRTKNLLSQRAKTNNAIKEFHNLYNRHLNDSQIKAIYSLLTQIKEQRAKSKNSFGKFITQINSLIIKKISNLAHYSLNPKAISLLIHYRMLLEMIDNSSQEKNFIYTILNENRPLFESEIKKWIKLLQKAQKIDFEMINDKETKNKIARILKQEKNKKVFYEILNCRADIIEASSSGGFITDANQWYNSVSKKIEILEEAGYFLRKSINIEIEKEQDKNIVSLFISFGASLLCLFVLFALKYTPIAQKTKNRSSLKVLVIDKNAINQKLTKKVLEELGLKVTLAKNSQEVFEKEKLEDFCLIFINVKEDLEETKDLLQTLCKFEQKNSLKHIPVVAITSKDSYKTFIKKPDAFLQKPLQKEEIQKVLDSLLAKH